MYVTKITKLFIQYSGYIYHLEGSELGSTGIPEHNVDSGFWVTERMGMCILYTVFLMSKNFVSSIYPKII